MHESWTVQGCCSCCSSVIERPKVGVLGGLDILCTLSYIIGAGIGLVSTEAANIG